MYILDEVPYCWIDDQVKDPAYAPYLLAARRRRPWRGTRTGPASWPGAWATRTPTGIDSQMVIGPGQARPTRPARRSSPGRTPNSIKGQYWQDDHYPGPDTIDRFARNTQMGREHHGASAHLLREGSPGLRPRRVRSLVRDADQDLGQAVEGPEHPRLVHLGVAEPGHRRQERRHDDRLLVRPGPSAPGEQQGHRDRLSRSQARMVDRQERLQPGRRRRPAPSARRAATCTVPITNHYSFTDLNELTCRWTALNGGATLQSGVLHVACAPMQSVTASFPAPAGMTALRLEFLHPDGTSVIAFNLAVDGVPLPAAPAGAGAGRRADRAGRPGHAHGPQCPPADRVRQAHRDHSVLARQRPGRAAGRPDAQPGRGEGRQRAGDVPRQAAAGHDRRPGHGDAGRGRRDARRRDQHRPRGGGRAVAGHARDHLRHHAGRRDDGRTGP